MPTDPPAHTSTPDESLTGHVPVLIQPVLRLLNPQPGQVYLDCTLGRGGHTQAIAPLLFPRGCCVGLDVDPLNLEYARSRLANMPVPVHVIQANFIQARSVLDELGLDHADLLLADLGFASNQMGDPTRGFSFAADGPLDMRLDPRLPTTAADLVNNLPPEELANLIYHYGEERLSRRIARFIAEQRAKTPIQTTSALAQIVRRAYGPWGHRQRIDPATRTFMALRIAVNAELEALDQLLRLLPDLLKPGGKAAIISFHSLEDRRVKQAFAAWQQEGLARRLTSKPIVADELEINLNPRSRSAKLRALEWIKPSVAVDMDVR